MENLNSLISYVDTESGPQEREIKFGIKGEKGVIEGGQEQNIGLLQHLMMEKETGQECERSYNSDNENLERKHRTPDRRESKEKVAANQ